MNQDDNQNLFLDDHVGYHVTKYDTCPVPPDFAVSVQKHSKVFWFKHAIHLKQCNEEKRNSSIADYALL
jgi:hypothetical protein